MDCLGWDLRTDDDGCKMTVHKLGHCIRCLTAGQQILH